jgi:hypothetical protein
MNPGKLLVVIGLVIVAVGLIVWFGSGIKWLRLGRLPGDIAIERDGLNIYIPITTMLLLSAVFTLIGWLVGLFRG